MESEFIIAIHDNNKTIKRAMSKGLKDKIPRIDDLVEYPIFVANMNQLAINCKYTGCDTIPNDLLKGLRFTQNRVSVTVNMSGEREDMLFLNVINFFDDIENAYKPLSNYYRRPGGKSLFIYKGAPIDSSEKAFQAAKYYERTGVDMELYERYAKIIRSADHPDKTKRLANLQPMFKDAPVYKGSPYTVNGTIAYYKSKGLTFDGPWWGKNRDRVMYDIVKAKFDQNDDLKALLMGTGDAILREASEYDDYWGGIKPSKGKQTGNIGKNMLGRILMMIREEFRRGSLTSDERKSLYDTFKKWSEEAYNQYESDRSPNLLAKIGDTTKFMK